MARNASGEANEQAQTGLAATQWPWLPMPVRNPFLAPVQAKKGSTHAPITALGTEWMDFVNKRLQEDIELPQKLVACKGLDEMWRAYSEFLLKMAEDYQSELSELAKLGQVLAKPGHATK